MTAAVKVSVSPDTIKTNTETQLVKTEIYKRSLNMAAAGTETWIQSVSQTTFTLSDLHQTPLPDSRATTPVCTSCQRWAGWGGGGIRQPVTQPFLSLRPRERRHVLLLPAPPRSSSDRGADLEFGLFQLCK